MRTIENKYADILTKFENILIGKLIRFSDSKIKSTGYVLDSLEAGIWSFMNTDSYDECIFKAINLGGDTDTIACIAGGLAGICYGVGNINNNWIQMLAKNEEINTMINNYLEVIRNK